MKIKVFADHPDYISSKVNKWQKEFSPIISKTRLNTLDRSSRVVIIVEYEEASTTSLS